MIDEASIYNRALTPAEIRALFTAGVAGKCATSTTPVILSQPADVTISAGGDASFTVVATGAPPLGYQWRHEGTNLGSAGGSTLTLTNVQFSDAGRYSVIVSNSLDSAISSNAVLTVNPALQCAPPPSGLVSGGAAPGKRFGRNRRQSRNAGRQHDLWRGTRRTGFVFDGNGAVVQLGNPTNLRRRTSRSRRGSSAPARPRFL